MSLISYIVFLSNEGKYFTKSEKNWNWWLIINSLLVAVINFFIIEKSSKGYRIAVC